MKKYTLVIGDLHGDIVSHNRIKVNCGRKVCDVEYSPEKFLELADDFSGIHRYGKMAVFDSDSKLKTIYLGDYGDRGDDPFGIYYSAVSEAIENPGEVVLLRGNHEDGSWDMRMGEIDPNVSPFEINYQLMERFGIRNGREILGAIAGKIWLNLPYSALIEGKYWFVHGGVPVFGKESGSSVDRGKIENPNSEIEKEMMWNDPMDVYGNGGNLRGYGTFSYGTQSSKELLNSMGAKTIIRSHEPDKVLESSQNGLVLTVGSCPNSYSRMAEGAYLLIKSGKESLNADGLINKYGHRFFKISKS